MRVSNTANSAPLPNKECIITRNRKHAATLDQAEMTLSNHGLDSAEINPEVRNFLNFSFFESADHRLIVMNSDYSQMQQEFCGESQTVDDNDGGDSSKDKFVIESPQIQLILY